MRKDMILERIDALKGMHTLMRHMNNEEWEQEMLKDRKENS